MIDIKRNRVFELLGAVPTNPRWSWSALSPDHRIAIFTLWEDQKIGSKNPLSWDNLDTPSRNGELDQRRNLELVLEKSIPAYGLVYIARDPTRKDTARVFPGVFPKRLLVAQIPVRACSSNVYYIW